MRDITGGRYATTATDVGAILRVRPVGGTGWQTFGPIAVFAGYRG
jgi:hypothetical protein